MTKLSIYVNIYIYLYKWKVWSCLVDSKYWICGGDSYCDIYIYIYIYINGKFGHVLWTPSTGFVVVILTAKFFGLLLSAFGNFLFAQSALPQQRNSYDRCTDGKNIARLFVI